MYAPTLMHTLSIHVRNWCTPHEQCEHTHQFLTRLISMRISFPIFQLIILYVWVRNWCAPWAYTSESGVCIAVCSWAYTSGTNACTLGPLWRDLPESSPSSIRAPKSDMSRLGFEPPTSYPAGGHSSKELSRRLTLFSIRNLYTANEGPVRIQYKCLVPMYVFPEMKLLFPK